MTQVSNILLVVVFFVAMPLSQVVGENSAPVLASPSGSLSNVRQENCHHFCTRPGKMSQQITQRKQQGKYLTPVQPIMN